MRLISDGPSEQIRLGGNLVIPGLGDSLRFLLGVSSCFLGWGGRGGILSISQTQGNTIGTCYPLYEAYKLRIQSVGMFIYESIQT